MDMVWRGGRSVEPISLEGERQVEEMSEVQPYPLNLPANIPKNPNTRALALQLLQSAPWVANKSKGAEKEPKRTKVDSGSRLTDSCRLFLPLGPLLVLASTSRYHVVPSALTSEGLS